MRARRVVTGHDAQGKAVIVGDERVEPITVTLLPGVEFHRVWGGDEPPRFPNDGAMPPNPMYFPPIGGYRFGFFTLPPAAQGVPLENSDVGAALQELEARLPGLAQYMEPGAPGMHTTPTIDVDFVISGEVVLELDNGVETRLRPGDSVVQNGTRHRWRNDGATAAVVAYFICGAHHDRFSGA